MNAPTVVDLRAHPGRRQGSEPALSHVWVEDRSGAPVNTVASGDEVTVRIHYELNRRPRMPLAGVAFETPEGVRVLGINNRFGPGAKITDGASRGTFSCHFRRLSLAPGVYFLTVAFSEDGHEDIDSVERAFRLTVTGAEVDGMWVPDVEWSHGQDS